MSAGNQQVFNEILVFHCGCASTSTTSTLRLVVGQGLCFCVTLVRDCDDTIFFGNQVFNGQIVSGIGDFSEAIIPKVLYKLLELLSNDRSQSIGVTQNLQKVCNFSNLVSVLLE